MIAKLKKHPVLLTLVTWFSVMWSWSFFTDSLELANSKSQGLILAFVVVAINVAVSTVIVWYSLKYIAKIHVHFGTKKFLLLGLPLFALTDFLVCWGTTIIWLGPQGNVDNILPMGSLSLLLIRTPLAFAARFVGFYGLAAIAWLTLYLAFQPAIHEELGVKAQKAKHKTLVSSRRYVLVPLFLAVIGATVGWYVYKTPDGVPIKATLISETLTRRVRAIDPKDIDLVVFPEYGLEKITNDNLKERVGRTKGEQHPVYFLGSEQIFTDGTSGHRNNMMFGNTTDGILERQDKYRLIPGGEDLPYVLRVIFRLTGQRSTLDYFTYAKSVIKGEQQLQPFVINDKIRVAAAVCSSIIAPQDYRAFARSGATIFTNSASLSTFKGSRLFAWQQKSMARFMAIANSRYFLQSANAASAYALDNNGNQLAETRDVSSTQLVAVTNSKKTVYTHVGEWLVYLGILIAVGYLIVYRRKNLQKSLSRFATIKR